jgi:selenocysteine-specific translation elongation factor
LLKSINFVILGDSSIAAQLGKKGTATDIVIHDRKTADTVYTWTTPTGDKIQSLMQAVNIAEYAILNVAKLDKFLGEQIIALDSVGLSDGLILHSFEVESDKLKTLLKGTALANYQFIDSVDQLKQEMTKLKPKSAEGPITISIDHAFDVKGVGAVALGVVKQGAVKVHDELVLLPGKKNVLIKSIQMHDEPVESSSSPARVGLAIKGASADDISRGDVICAPNTAKVSSGAVAIKFVKSPFFKGDLPENHAYLMSLGMQVKAAKVKFEGEILQVTPEKAIVYKQGETIVLLKPDSQGTRIAGKGLIQ